MYRNFLPVIFLFVFQVAAAQNINHYILTENSHTGSLTDMQGSSELIGNNRSQAASQVVNIGFDFVFMGRVYSTFSVNTNGVLRLGDEQVLVEANTYGIPSNERIVPLAGVSADYMHRVWWWYSWSSGEADLKTNDDGKVHYKVTGKAPERIMVVEWKNVGLNLGYGISNGTFQVRLYESDINSAQSGRIEFVYDHFDLDNNYRNFYFRTGFGIGPENGNFVAIDHETLSLTGQQNYVSGPVSGDIRYFSSTGANDKLLLRFEAFHKPVGQFSNFELACPAKNAFTIRFAENSPDEAGIAVFKKQAGQKDTKYQFIQSLPPDARAFKDFDFKVGKKYTYRFYLLGEGKYAESYTDYTTEAIQPGVAYEPIKSGNWSDRAVWGGRLPGRSDDIIIGCASSIFLSVDKDVQIKSLSLESGSFLTIEDGVTLYVSGDFVNNGVFNPIGNAHVVLNGNSAQTLTHSGQGITNDTQFTAVGQAVNWNAYQTGIVAEKTIEVKETDFSAIKSVTVDIQHNYLRDITVYLITPNGQLYTLARSRGQHGQDYTGVIFTETGKPLPPTIQNVNMSGAYRPEESFAAYTGPFGGKWTLRIKDDFTGAGGALTGFAITLSKGTSNDLLLPDLTINNLSAQGITLNSGLIVQETFQLISGIVHTSESATVLLDAGAQCNEGNASSFIDGPMLKRGKTDFTFPVGNAGKWAPVIIENMRNADNSTVFQVAYHKKQYGKSNRLAPGISSVSNNEYWDIEPITGKPTVDIVLCWKDAASSSITDLLPGDLVVAHYTNDNWVNEGGVVDVIFSGLNLPGSIKTSNISTFSPFTFGSEGSPGPLPVTLVSFTGTEQPEGNRLHWETASESNNSHFEVEKSSDAQNWQTIERIEGHGTTQNSQTYSFLDTKTQNGIIYYRLKQVDYDGAFEYSQVIGLSRHQKAAHVNVFPNPASDQISIQCAAYPAELLLVSPGGTTILHQKIEEFQSTVQLPLLSDGLYLLKLSNEAGTICEKLIIQRK